MSASVTLSDRIQSGTWQRHPLMGLAKDISIGSEERGPAIVALVQIQYGPPGQKP